MFFFYFFFFFGRFIHLEKYVVQMKLSIKSQIWSAVAVLLQNTVAFTALLPQFIISCHDPPPHSAEHLRRHLCTVTEVDAIDSGKSYRTQNHWDTSNRPGSIDIHCTVYWSCSIERPSWGACAQSPPTTQRKESTFWTFSNFSMFLTFVRSLAKLIV